MYTSLAANSYLVAVVTSNHFEPGAYSNIIELPGWVRGANITPPEDRYGHTDTGLFSHVLEGYNTNANSYEDLTPHECTKLYSTDYISSHRNLFLITKHNSNTTHNNTLLDMINVRGEGISPSSWMCAYDQAGKARVYLATSFMCDPSQLTSNFRRGLPWRVKLTTEEEVEISGCKSEKTVEKCKVRFSLKIMIVVICCNLVKACCMVMAVVRSREPTLVTLGDAVDSFLRIPDPTTRGICSADRQLIEGEWRRWRRTEARLWKPKEVQRRWTGASKTRWIICTIMCSIIIYAAGVLLQLGINHDEEYWSTGIRSM